MVGRLVAAGVAVDKAATDDGSTPLFVAAQEGNEAVVGRLIAAGAAVDTATTDTEGTPMFAAAMDGFEAVRGGSADRGRGGSRHGSDGRPPEPPR